MPAAATSDRLNRGGKLPVLGFKLSQSLLAFRTINIEHPNPGAGAGRDSDVVLADFPPIANGALIDRRAPKVVIDQGFFRPYDAGEHPHAPGRECERCLAEGGASL